VLVSAVACGGGSTDSTPPLPLTTVTRLELQVGADSVLVGDSLVATARGFNREGTVISLSTIVWSTPDSSIGSASPSGVLRARNVGTVRLDALAAGAVGSRTIRVVPRPLRLRMQAPDTVELVDEIQLLTQVETTAGVPLPEVAPRIAVSDTSIARAIPFDLARARVIATRPGTTDLLAIVGRDTTRRRMVVKLTPLRSLTVAITPRVVGVGDSVPVALTAIDSTGRSVPTSGTAVGFEPAGTMIYRNGHAIALTLGRVVIKAQNGTSLASDTLTAQGPSEFPLDLVDGDGQRPLPLRMLLSMERVALRWRRVIRAAPPGDNVNLVVGECRNAVPVNQFITGVRVLIKLDTLPSRIAGVGGPCAIRPNGLPLLGTISINYLALNTLGDAKLDDLIQHEVGHVLGLGTIWSQGGFAPLVEGDSNAVDPIFVGRNAIAAFTAIGRSADFTGRRVPVQLGSRGHWRFEVFSGELMAPALSATAQPVSSVTIGALRDLGWVVEPEAYDDFTLPSTAFTGGARVQGASEPVWSLEGDVLRPQLMVRAGRKVRLDPNGLPVLR
jgi:Pilus formation protein N terminal region